jgi:hypothetical protein
MKFIYSDSLDMIDPQYDFAADRHAPKREHYWDDVYPHEYFSQSPYDGVLVSRAIVGDEYGGGKYSANQAMRFRRVGARRFLRMDVGRAKTMPIFGDCGAFSYADDEVPPYSVDNTLDFYADAQFTHACSLDHIIFEFDPNVAGLKGGSELSKFRWDITLENAAAFFKRSKTLGKGFTPLGVVQGWSPASKAEAAAKLEKMGYNYLAIGGLVPLRPAQIHLCLQAIRTRISHKTKLHLLGFAKAEQIGEFLSYGIESFDSTSPLVRAFMDAKANYYAPGTKGGLEYYTAIRVPQATENNRLVNHAKAGRVNQEELIKLEAESLSALRRFDANNADLEETLEPVLAYNAAFLAATLDSVKVEASINEMRERYTKTLTDKPWKRCKCAICKAVSIEVIIFRTSNRNKRRGFHNLHVYHKHLQQKLQSASHAQSSILLSGDLCAAE